MLGNGIMDMMRKTMKTLFNPITKLIGFIGKSMVGAASAGAKTALFFPSMALQGLSVLTAGKRRKEYVKFYKNYYSKGNISGALRDMWSAQAEDGKKRNIFGKVSDVIGAYMGSGPIGDAARAGWNAQMADDGKDHLRWREVPAERRQLRKDRKQRKIENKQCTWRGPLAWQQRAPAQVQAAAECCRWRQMHRHRRRRYSPVDRDLHDWGSCSRTKAPAYTLYSRIAL